MALRQEVEKILTENKNGIHVSEISNILIKRDIIQHDMKNLEDKISSLLSSDIRKNKEKSNFRRVSNGKGGYRKGFYRLKKTTTSKEQKTIKLIQNSKSSNTPKIKSGYMGKAGEYAVLGELLYDGFNANIMSVDEGIDIVASKNNKFFYIQVKTTQINSNRVTIPGIKFERFTQYAEFDAYYIFVLRHYVGNSRRHEYIILRSFEIEKLIETGFISKENTSINLSISFDTDKLLLIKGHAKEDITYNLNNFSIIK